jgi:anti-sigma factor RsiW
MTCDSARELISPLLDAELDAVQASEVERHMQTCVACAELKFEYLQLRERVRADAPYYSATEELRARIDRALRQAASAKDRPRAPWGWIAFASAAGFAAALLLAFVLGPNFFHSERAGGDLIAQEVVSSHVRSLMAGHLIDVRSSDQHTVKPWFAGKLDFSPKVKDLAPQGYGLTGGRLDYLDGRPVAGLVFQRRQHVINLFVWPSQAQSGSRLSNFAITGFNIVHWSEAGLTYWAVSDLNAAELRTFAQLYSE